MGKSSRKDKTVDGKMAYELAVAYFCTGDPDWFEKITDPALKVFCDLLYQMVCKKDLPHIEVIINWVTNLQKSMGEDTKYKDCMEEETIEALNNLFCKGEESVLVLENLMKFFVKWSCEGSAWDWESTLCKALTFLHKISRSLVFGFSPLVCGLPERGIAKRNENSYREMYVSVFEELSLEGRIRLEKRQYDLSSMVKFLRELVCDKDTFLQIAKYVEDEVAEDQSKGLTDLASLLHGFICCTLFAIQV